MDLIYTDPQRVEIGYFDRPALDLSFGDDENDFALTIPRRDHCCEAGSLIYAEDTEYGGIVDGIKIDTAEDTVTYIGRTWHGILASKVIVPDTSGAVVTGVTVAVEDAKLVISGDANACLRWLIKRIGLDSLFVIPDTAAGVNVSKYPFEPYCDAYKAIRGMLDSAALRADILLQHAELFLSAAKRYDYSVDQEFEGDLIEYRMDKYWHVPNHLVCLGAGEGADRIIVHLYADNDGNISETQTFTGLDEIAAVMDSPGELTAQVSGNSIQSAFETASRDGYLDVLAFESAKEAAETKAAEERAKKRADLVEKGKEYLLDLRDIDQIDVDFDADEHEYYIGDIVGAYEDTTGESVAAAISQKILRLEHGTVTISYAVKDPTPPEDEEASEKG